MFIYIGTAPRTEFVAGLLERNEKGYIVTGPDLLKSNGGPHGWTLDRNPLMFETNVPGIFAAGDVRAGANMRVASAVGEGFVVSAGKAALTGFETLTHARILAAQGDRSCARRIARAVLDRDPSDAAARELLEALGAEEDAPTGEPGEAVPDVPVAAAASDLRETFRARLGLDPPRDPRASLSRWLDRIRANRTRIP